MKITLCAINSKYIHSTLAVWYLKSATGKSAQCRVIEGTINERIDVLYDRIVKSKPEMVAFSTYIWNIEIVLELSKRLKERKNIEILLGGPEVSYNARELLKKHAFVDYIISGEGEEPFSKLCKGEDFEKIEGLFYRKGGDVVEKEPFVSCFDPPNPYTKEYLDTLNGRIAYIETSRGCPYHCAFCLSGRCGGVRFFDFEKAKENIILLANSGTQTVKFIDRTFNASKKRARDIFDFIINEHGKRIPKGVCFHFEIEGELLDVETFEVLKKAPKGLIQFEIGLQSFNEKTLNVINRKTNMKLLCENISRVIELGNIHTHIDLIIGLPYEDWSSFENSFDSAYKLHPHMLQIGFLKMLNGAVLRSKENVQNCSFTDTPPYEILSTQWLNGEEIKKLHFLEDVFEKMYNSQRFGLTCEYLDTLFDSSFKMYMGLGEYVASIGGAKKLDDFTKAIYDYFGSLENVNRNLLRDKLALDRLATNRMGALPEFLKIRSSFIKKCLNKLEENEITKRPKNVKRAATLLLTENKLAYVDYEERDYLTNRFLLKFTEICDN